MTREEAIKKLTQLKNKFLDEYIDFDGTTSAYNMAIEALKEEPRIKAKWIEKDVWEPLPWDSSPLSYDTEDYDETTHSERRQHWVCGHCNYDARRSSKPGIKYCPNCGAKMEI